MALVAKINLAQVADKIEKVKGMQNDDLVRMLNVTRVITKRNTQIEANVPNLLSTIATLTAKVNGMEEISDASQVAEMEEFREAYKQLQEARVLAVDVVNEVKEDALRENQQWVKVRGFLEAFSAPAEEKAKRNADYLKLLEERQVAERVAGWQAQLHALNDFSKSDKDLRGWGEDVFRAYLFSQQERVKQEEAEAKAKAEVEARAEEERKRLAEIETRLRILTPYAGHLYMPMQAVAEAENFEALLQEAKAAFEAEQQRLKDEAERLRREQLVRDNLRKGRELSLAPFRAFCKDAVPADLAEMSDAHFAQLLLNAQQDAEEAKKEQVRKDAEREKQRQELAKAQEEADRLRREQEEAKKREEEAAKAEAERQEAIRRGGDKAKIQEVIRQLGAIEVPACESEKGKASASAFAEMRARMVDYLAKSL